MELTALINAFKSLPEDADLDIYSDSELCVKTLNEWAAAWEKRGWKRSSGPIANLELVQELYALKKAHAKVRVKWIKAHNGWLWNEYADSLATAWTRSEL
jgi:ribonuclease HI